MAGEIAAGATVLQGVVGYKANRSAAKYAQQVAARDAQIAENESLLLARAKRDEESRARRRGEYTKGAAQVAIAKSGVQVTGSSLDALAEVYFGVEDAAARIQYASSIEQAAKEAEVESIILSGQSRAAGYKQAAIGSILGATTEAYAGYEEAN
jgi:hypothetical protein